MVIEFLYKELMLYGEEKNYDYFKLLFPEATIIDTGYNDRPYFADHDIDMLFIGPMPENFLDKIITKLEPFKTRLKQLIDNNVMIFIINNAMDIFGESIEVRNGEPSDTLKLLPYKTVRDYDKRKYQLGKVSFEGQTLVAMQISFSEYFGNEGHDIYTSLTANMDGFNSNTKAGGFRINNTFCIEKAGMFFLSNPYLVRRLRKHFTGDEEIPFNDIMNYQYERFMEYVK